jgi:multidrug efflux pump subunit AcrB
VPRREATDVWLIRIALRHPISMVVALIAIGLSSILALTRMPIDIFPKLNLPVIYVAQPFGGMDAAQMEGYLVYYYEYHFLYITGIQSVESKSIQNVGLLKLTFHPGTDMAQAAAQTIAYVDRARAFMPTGTVPPFVMRFDAGSVPVGYLVFSSQTRSPKEIQDLALNRVRPLFATIAGLSAPPPFGGNQRTIIINVDPNRLRSYHMSPEEVVKAVSSGNSVVPSGNVRTSGLLRITPINGVVSNPQELMNLPIRTGAGPTVFLRDLGSVEDSMDTLTGYAHFNGKRTVYIPVTKRADASTIDVVNGVKQNLSNLQAVIPSDIKISFELDQSVYVRNALSSVLREALLGALLTGAAVLLFLRDWRSSLIVVGTIPFALLAALVALWGAGQSINIMTLGGLALAVGILVDEATVAIENIHRHLADDKPLARSVFDGSIEVILPRLLAMLSILAVFIPSFFMKGVAQSLFVPLSLAVGFAMLASYFLASSFVPVVSMWVLRQEKQHRETELLMKIRDRLGDTLNWLMPRRWILISAYAVGAVLIIGLIGPRLGRSIFPRVPAGQMQLRFRAPVGTDVETTETEGLQLLKEITSAAGPANVASTLDYMGVQPPSYPVNTIFLWTSGEHEGLMRVALKPESKLRIEDLEESLRRTLPDKFPNMQFSFEAGDIVSQIMNFGAPTPVEVNIMGNDLAATRQYAEKVRKELTQIGKLRDLQVDEPLDYPSINVDVDRERAAQMGITAQDVGRAFLASTSSSRLVTPNYWADPKSGVGYQIQVQVPPSAMTSLENIEHIPVTPGASEHPLLGDVAHVSYGTIAGEYHRLNGQRMVTLTANIVGQDLGHIANDVQAAISRAGKAPQATSVQVRGQIQPMHDTLMNLAIGLLLSVLVIYLLLAANFQSVRLPIVVVSAVPAVICGVILILLLTGTTLNIQSFMGAIMAIGVAVANAILLVVFAERYRREGFSSRDAAIEAARTRMRPILMTATAMTCGMIPMALGLGEDGQQTAPLGRAVIGGLVIATAATLLILPSVFSIVQQRAQVQSPSLDPDDPRSRHAEGHK